jgi:anthranilate synthase component 1
VPDPSLPRFFGGAVGFMGYDVVNYFEDLPTRPKEGLDLPDVFFMITDTLVIFDNVTHKLKVVSNAHVKGRSVEAAYKEAVAKINRLVKKIKAGVQGPGSKPGGKSKQRPISSRRTSPSRSTSRPC